MLFWREVFQAGGGLHVTFLGIEIGVKPLLLEQKLKVVLFAYGSMLCACESVGTHRKNMKNTVIKLSNDHKGRLDFRFLDFGDLCGELDKFFVQVVSDKISESLAEVKGNGVFCDEFKQGALEQELSAITSDSDSEISIFEL